MRKIVFKITTDGEGMFHHGLGHNLKYNLSYIKGEITTAPEHSLGIFCFKTRKAAIDFLQLGGFRGREILRVIPIKRGNTPKLVCKRGGLFSFYKGFSVKRNKIRPPKGTICYPAVKVLKEVKRIES